MRDACTDPRNCRCNAEAGHDSPTPPSLRHSLPRSSWQCYTHTNVFEASRNVLRLLESCFARSTSHGLVQYNIHGYTCLSPLSSADVIIARIRRMLTSPFLTACARSRLSSHTISAWLVSYTSDSSCGRASSVGCTFQDVEVTCLALPSRKGVALWWFDCRFTSCHHAFAGCPRGIVSARCNLGNRNFCGPETRLASAGDARLEPSAWLINIDGAAPHTNRNWYSHLVSHLKTNTSLWSLVSDLLGGHL